MGVNVQKKAQKSFEKHIDAALEDVASGDLFNLDLSACPRRFLADPGEGSTPCIGEDVDLEIQGGVLIGVQGSTRVFRAEQPPADVLAHVRAKGGVAEGRIVSVNDVSGMLEIDLC